MAAEKLSVNEIKIKNRQMIYQHIRMHGPVSKQDIVVALQLVFRQSRRIWNI